MRSALAIALSLALSVPAMAITLDANGNGTGMVRSSKTGATARVSPQYAAKFQAYINAIEAAGASVRFMGGIRHGKCWSGGMHPCGRALDVCQTGRDRVDPRCHLPDRNELARIAHANGLFEGGRWCRGDYGHAQVGESAAPCSRPGGSMIASRKGGTVTAYSARTRKVTPRTKTAFVPPDRLTASY